MRKEKALTELMRGLVRLLDEEAAQNPAFALKVESLLAIIPDRRVPAKRTPRTRQPEHLPDVHAEWANRGEPDFRLWLRDQPLPVLRGLIRLHDLDSTRRTTKWKEPAKLADFIADGVRGRLSRGGAFIRQ